MNRLFRLIPLLAVAGSPCWAFGQDTGGALPPASESKSIVISAANSSDGSGELQVMGFSSVDGNTMTFATPMMFGADGSFTSMAGMDQFGMLGNPEIQKELDLVGDQRDQFERLQKEYNRRIQERVGMMGKGGFDPKRAKEMGEEIKNIQEQQKKDLEDLLLPHQVNRLQQIQFQQKIKGMGAVNALSDKKILEELGISEEQLAKLKEKAKELTAELQKKIQKLRDETQDSLLKELTSEQREKLKAMTGEKFELQQPANSTPSRIQNRIQRRQSNSDGG